MAGVVLALGLAGCASTPSRPRLDSAEYLRSWGLGLVNAAPAFATGASGRGVTVALLDCGLPNAQPEIQRNISPNSVDLTAPRVIDVASRHGDWVAGPLGSALDGRGLLGVAYNATLLAIRTDIDGGWEGDCAFRPADLARGLDYATDHHARVVVMPLQGKKSLGPAFEAALQRSVASGAVIVIAAGNDSRDEPSWPARYAADPRFERSIIAVGSRRYDGVMSPWSNRAGQARARYLIAPGERVVTDCGKRYCKLVSGTSFSAAYVGGAVALLMEARPGLPGADIAELLLKSAKDLGDPGVDATYGRGALDIGGAFVQRRAVAGDRKG